MKNKIFDKMIEYGWNLEDFNKVYEDITNAYDSINEFYMKHVFGKDNIDNRIVPVMADIWDMLGKCKEMGHEVAEHLTWD